MRAPASRPFEQGARQALAAARGQAADVMIAPDAGDVIGAAVPGHARLRCSRLAACPPAPPSGSTGRARRRATARPPPRRSARPLCRLDRDVDALRPQHAGDDRDLQRRLRRQRLRAKAARHRPRRRRGSSRARRRRGRGRGAPDRPGSRTGSGSGAVSRPRTSMRAAIRAPRPTRSWRAPRKPRPVSA